MFDFYAHLAGQRACPTDGPVPGGLASGFVDGCTAWSTRGDDQKNEARSCYMQRAQAKRLELPGDLSPLLIPKVSDPVLPEWIGLEVSFVLETAWYSKDDRPFHVLDNPVRKDRVFGVPYMSATSWKGMLRWACRMQAGLREHLEKTKGKFEGWRDPAWIVHLFGNEKGEEKDFRQGTLVFYPTGFDKIGFEVINPQSRARRAGTQPIYYEVVPGRRPKPRNSGDDDDGGRGTLYLLYAPWPAMKDLPGLDRKQAINNLLKAIEELLTTYGISAKRTVGWGTAKIKEWKAYRKGKSPVSVASRTDLWNKVQAWFGSGATP